MDLFLESNSWRLLLKASWQAAVLIVLVLAMQRLLGRRLRPSWRYGLWLLVVLRLALPWTFPSAVSLFNLLSLPDVSNSLTRVVSRWKIPAASDSQVPKAAHVTAVGVSAEATGASLEAAAPRLSAERSWLPLAWAAGAFVFTLGLTVNHLRFHRRVARSRPLIDEPALNLLEDCKQRMGIRTPIMLVETAAVDGPSLFGFLRPRLLLPAGFTRQFSHDELRFVFLHELGHVKRHDIPLGWLTVLLQILHWFNPLVWLAFSRMRVDRELACDALALSYAEEQEAKSYGLTIVKVLENFGDSLRAPGLAGIIEDRQHLKERIRMITQFHKSNRGLAVAALLFIGLGLITLTDAQSGDTTAASTYEQQQQKMADGGNKWAAYRLWDAYYRGTHGVKPDAAKADKWLREFVQNVWVVRFEPVDDFKPANPREFLGRIEQYAHSYSGETGLGENGFFRTTKQDGDLVASFLSNYPDKLKASLAKVPGLKITSVEQITPEQFIKYEESPQESLSNAQSGNRSPVSTAAAKSVPPRIIATSPAVGATDVDPGLTEITVTFDQDMGGGMSWTGGGPDFPPMREGQKAEWRAKRTCALPVKLEAGHYYRVGINSTGYQNFANEQGVAALPSAIFFTTQGASEDLKAKTRVPQVVQFDPDNGAQNVSPAVTELRVTFSVPMGGGCSWCTAGDDDSDFPKAPEGKRFYWTEDKKTCVLPVALKARTAYRLSLNAENYKNFQSDAGVPLEPVAYSFKTSDNP